MSTRSRQRNCLLDVCSALSSQAELSPIIGSKVILEQLYISLTFSGVFTCVVDELGVWSHRNSIIILISRNYNCIAYNNESFVTSFVLVWSKSQISRHCSSCNDIIQAYTMLVLRPDFLKNNVILVVLVFNLWLVAFRQPF